MGAQTSWWYCGVCGFRNHPRMKQDVAKCEQCGGDRADPNASDYVPSQGVA